MNFRELASHLNQIEIASGWETATQLQQWVREEQARLNRMPVCLEIGTFCGFTGLQMAEAGAAVVCVDTYKASDGQTESRGRVMGGSTLERFTANALAVGPRGPVVALVGASPDILKQLPADAFDLVFIDGDHSYQAVKADLAEAKRLLKEDGVLCGHDVGQLAVQRAVDEYGTENNMTCQTFPDQLWRLNKNAAPKPVKAPPSMEEILQSVLSRLEQLEKRL